MSGEARGPVPLEIWRSLMLHALPSREAVASANWRRGDAEPLVLASAKRDGAVLGRFQWRHTESSLQGRRAVDDFSVKGLGQGPDGEVELWGTVRRDLATGVVCSFDLHMKAIGGRAS